MTNPLADESLSPLEKLALVGLVSGDKSIGTAADAMLARVQAGRPKQRGMLNLGRGFLLDQDTGTVQQAPGYADYEAQTQDREDAQRREAEEARDRRAAASSTAALERVTASAEAREAVADRRFQQQDDRYAERDANQLSKQLDGLAEVQQSVVELDDVIAPYLQENPEDPSIPGIGRLSNIAMLGNATASGRAVRSKYAGVRNAILKARSGGAVTPGEADRLLEELGDSVLNSDSDFMRNWPSVKRRIQAQADNARSGVSPRALELYDQRRSKFASGAPAAPGAPPARKLSKSKSGRDIYSDDGGASWSYAD